MDGYDEMIAQADAGRKSRIRTFSDKKARTGGGPCFSGKMPDYSLTTFTA